MWEGKEEKRTAGAEKHDGPGGPDRTPTADLYAAPEFFLGVRF